jgi:hypothetical protein
MVWWPCQSVQQPALTIFKSLRSCLTRTPCPCLHMEPWIPPPHRAQNSWVLYLLKRCGVDASIVPYHGVT